MLRKSYGEVIIPKGSIFYHTTDEKFKLQSPLIKPMLFCTFHPSEWDILNKYIVFIQIEKDLSLLFMVENIVKARIISALTSFSNYPTLNLSKKYKEQLECYSNELKKENFDGWFSSIENKLTVEIALINDPSIFSILKTEKYDRYWSPNGYIKHGKKRIKDWGEKYKIYLPLKFSLNIRFKKIIKNYKQYVYNQGFLNYLIFQVLINNVEIIYHKGDVETIIWKC